MIGRIVINTKKGFVCIEKGKGTQACIIVNLETVLFHFSDKTFSVLNLVPINVTINQFFFHCGF